MMDSHYQVQGDMVMTTITFVPNHQDKEVTCEASHEALSEPIRRTVVIEVESDTSAIHTSSSEMDASDEDPSELIGKYPIHKDAIEADGEF